MKLGMAKNTIIEATANMADGIVLGILGVIIFFVLRYKWKTGRSQNGGCGCSCNNGKCRNCSAMMEGNIKKPKEQDKQC